MTRAELEALARDGGDWIFLRMNDDSCKSIAAEARRIVEGRTP